GSVLYKGIVAEHKEKCDACGGSGQCTMCKGTGNGGQCTNCGGKGPCPQCEGTGNREPERTKCPAPPLCASEQTSAPAAPYHCDSVARRSRPWLPFPSEKSCRCCASPLATGTMIVHLGWGRRWPTTWRSRLPPAWSSCSPLPALRSTPRPRREA